MYKNKNADAFNSTKFQDNHYDRLIKHCTMQKFSLILQSRRDKKIFDAHTM